MSRDRIIQLQESAENLGFETIEEALNNGYHEVQDLVNGIFTLEKIDTMAEQEKAHEAWLEEKRQVLNDLDIVAHSDVVPFEHKEIVKQAYKFIKEQCHD